jgi:medium-chain acyl-[acyl-carrier-protein] hydrolase
VESFAIPDELTGDAMWSAVARVLRADLRILETYHPSDAPPLDVPLVVLGATGDALAPPERLLAWKQRTAGTFTLHLLEGGHMFVRDEPAKVESIVRSALARFAPESTARR